MLPKIDGKYLFILPLPLSAPGENATLYGVAYFYTDANFNVIGNKELLTCRGLDYRLPSPSYLFSLGIDPYTIKKGLTEDDFIEELDKIITNPNIDVFTWSIRNLQIAEYMSLRLFRTADILKRVHALVDINKVLKLHELLTEGKTVNSDSMLTCAKRLGFKEQLSKTDILGRLDALLYIVQQVHMMNGPLLNYMLKPFTDKCNELANSITKQSFLIDYNTKERCIEILKPIDLTDLYLDALYFNGQDVARKIFPLTEFSILAPSDVLTDSRQKILNLDLNSIKELLNSMDANAVEINPPKKHFIDAFFDKFTKEDLALFEENMSKNKASFVKAPLSASLEFRKLVALFRGNNYKKTLLDNELQAFYKQCAQSIHAQLNSYSKELLTLTNIVNENSEDEVRLLEKIRTYPMDI